MFGKFTGPDGLTSLSQNDVYARFVASLEEKSRFQQLLISASRVAQASMVSTFLSCASRDMLNIAKLWDSELRRFASVDTRAVEVDKRNSEERQSCLRREKQKIENYAQSRLDLLNKRVAEASELDRNNNEFLIVRCAEDLICEISKPVESRSACQKRVVDCVKAMDRKLRNHCETIFRPQIEEFKGVIFETGRVLDESLRSNNCSQLTQFVRSLMQTDGSLPLPDSLERSRIAQQVVAQTIQNIVSTIVLESKATLSWWIKFLLTATVTQETVGFSVESVRKNDVIQLGKDFLAAYRDAFIAAAKSKAEPIVKNALAATIVVAIAEEVEVHKALTSTHEVRAQVSAEASSRLRDLATLIAHSQRLDDEISELVNSFA